MHEAAHERVVVGVLLDAPALRARAGVVADLAEDVVGVLQLLVVGLAAEVREVLARPRLAEGGAPGDAELGRADDGA